MRKPINKNLGKNPADPDFEPDYDYESLQDLYDLEREMYEDDSRGEEY